MASKIVYLKCFLKWIIEVHRCRTIYNDIALILNEFSIGLRNPKLVSNQVTADRHYFRLGESKEIMLAS